MKANEDFPHYHYHISYHELTIYNGQRLFYSKHVSYILRFNSLKPFMR